MSQTAGEYGGFVPQTRILHEAAPQLMISNVYPLLPEAAVEEQFNIRGHAMVAKIILPGFEQEGVDDTGLAVMYAARSAITLAESSINRSRETQVHVVAPHTYSIIDETSLGRLADVGALPMGEYMGALAKGALKDIRVSMTTPTSWLPDCAIVIGREAEFASALFENPYVSPQHTGVAFGDATVTIRDIGNCNGTEVVYNPAAEIPAQTKRYTQ